MSRHAASGWNCKVRSPSEARSNSNSTTALFLGEVIYCREDEASFYVGVELEQALYGLSDLARALGAFSDSPSGPEQTDPVKERRYQN